MFNIQKPKTYLKTYFYSPHEIRFLKLNLQESMHHIDKMILCEFNRNHLGEDREFIFEQHKHKFTDAELSKIIYLPCDVKTILSKANGSDEIHKNEQLMRGYFASQIALKNSDIIVSVDADEIVFSNHYNSLLGSINIFHPAIKLKLNQFFYKVNYLWEGEIFIAPTIARASYYKNKFPGQWRYDGKLYPQIVGAHFSWCMTVDEMITKIASYSHHYDFRHLMDKAILTKAIANKEYPFDPQRDFNIKVLDMQTDKAYYPSSIYSMMEEFSELIG